MSAPLKETTLARCPSCGQEMRSTDHVERLRAQVRKRDSLLREALQVLPARGNLRRRIVQTIGYPGVDIDKAHRK